MKNLIKSHGSIALVAVGVLLIASVVVAQDGGERIIQNVENYYEAVGSFSGVGESLGVSSDPITGFNNVTVDDNLIVNATSTQQERVHGSRFGVQATVTQASTSTPGGFFSVQNTGDARICNTPLLDIWNPPSGAYTYRFGTSTSATLWTGNAGGSLMASTTVPTSTPVILSADGAGTSSTFGFHLGAPGTFYTLRHGIATSTMFVWQSGDYVLGAYDVDGAPEPDADSASTTSMLAKVHFDCYQR